MRSVDHLITGEDLELGIVDAGVGWVSPSGFFINAFVSWVRDFEVDETYLNTALSLGMVFSDNWSASIDYDNTDYFVPGSFVEPEGRLEKTLSFNLFYNF